MAPTGSLTGNSGGPVLPTLGNINTLGSGSITIVGNPGTSTLTTQLTGLVNHNVLVGAGTSTITSVAPSATSGIPLISQGVAADPIFGTAVVAGGGTGSTSFNIDGIVISGTTTTSPLTSLTLSNGQMVIGSTGVSPAVGTITSTGNTLTVTTGPGTLNLEVNGSVVGETITGNSGGALSPTAGNWNILGASAAAGSAPVTTSGSVSTLTVKVQTAQAIASTDATKIGLAAFDSADFTVDANGFVSAAGTGFIKTITGNSGGAEVPLANNFNILGTGSITVAGSANTETVQLTGLTNHAIQIGAGTATLTQLSPGTTGQVLQTNTGADPTWSTPTYPSASGSAGVILRSDGTNNVYTTATYPATTTINQILYSSSANVIGGLATGNNGVLITSATGVPSFLAAGTTGQILTATTGSPPTWASPATSGTVTTVSVVSANGFAGTVANATTTPAITLTTTITGVLSGNGTAISGSAVTQYDVLVGGASNAISSVGPGSAGQVLQSAGNAANPAYSTATYPSTTSINQILYSSAANTVSGLTATANGALITGAAGIPSIAALTDGQVIIGSSAGAPTAATITAGAGISVSNGHNSITIAGTGGGFTWHDVTGGSATVAAQNGYIADKSTLTTFTLPTNNAIGDTIIIVGKGSGGWSIVYTTGQNIIFGSSTTTTTTGNLASTNANDCVWLVCTTASASAPIFTVINAVGNLTVT